MGVAGVRGYGWSVAVELLLLLRRLSVHWQFFLPGESCKCMFLTSQHIQVLK